MTYMRLAVAAATVLLTAGCATSASTQNPQSGETKDDRPATASPASSDQDTLGCQGGQQSAVDLNIPLEIFRSTPRQAALAYEDGFSVTLVEQKNDRNAVVEAESVDGKVVRVFTVHKTDAGWSPGGFLECAY